MKVVYLNDILRFIGARLKNDVFTNTGTFLLRKNTLLQQEHILKLLQHQIDLSEYDIYYHDKDLIKVESEYDPSAIKKNEQELIEEITVKMTELFEYANINKKIPISELRNDIIPTVSHLSENPNIFKVLKILHEKDDYTYTHNISVAILSLMLGKWLNISKSDLQVLVLGAILHDIGTTQISNDILLKPGKLTEEEFSIIKKHPVYGYDMLKNTVGISSRASMIVLQHHEREDGTGYPLGLKADKIDMLTQIVAISDIFHAMISERNYRRAIPFYKVMRIMNQDSYGKLNPKVMQVFITRMMDSIIGNQVVLSDGRMGKVIMIKPYDIFNPIVKVDKQVVDLSSDYNLNIEKVSHKTMDLVDTPS